MINPLNNSSQPYQTDFLPENPHSSVEEEVSEIGQKRIASQDRPEANLEKRAKIDLSQRLWQALEEDNWVQVAEMLENGDVDINSAHPKGKYRGETPLWFAAINLQWGLVGEMLKCDYANVNATPLEGKNSGATVLWLAAAHNEWDLVREMLRFGNANVNATPEADCVTVLWLTASQKQWDLVREMLKFGNVNVNAPFPDGINRGVTVLLITASCSQWDLVMEMLKFGNANINAAPLEGDSRGRSVLWLAAKKRQWNVVWEMLKFGNADVNSYPLESVDTTVLLLAANQKQWDLVREMLKQSVSEVNINNCFPAIFEARQGELAYCCVFKYDFLKNCKNFQSLKYNAMKVVAKFAECFFDEPTLQKDLKFMFTRKATLTQLELLSLEFYPGIKEALNNWINAALEKPSEEKIQRINRENDLIKKLSFRERRLNPNVPQVPDKKITKQAVTNIHNMIEYCLNQFKSQPSV